MANLYCWSGAAGTGSGADWTNAKTTLTAAFVTEVAGDTIFVAHDHAESTASAITLTSSGTMQNPTKIICVNRAGTVPPVDADRRTTATVSTTASGSNITITGFAHYDGISFITNTATNFGNITLFTASSQWLRFDNCSLQLNNNASSTIFVGGGAGTLGGTYVELNNTTVLFGATVHTVQVVNALKWRNTPSALLGSPMPTNLFNPFPGRGVSVECIGVDFSAAGAGKTLVNAVGTQQGATFKFIDCKLDASVTKSSVQTGHGTNDIDFIRSGASGVNYTVHSQRISGLLTEETTIVRSGGASDGTTTIAWKVVTTANCTFSIPFECPPIAIWNDTVGSARTATIECIGAAVATDKEVWVDIEYLSNASSPQGAFVSDAAGLLATAANQTTSSATWGGSTAAFKLAVTFTPQQRGWVYARVRIGKASSTFYVDPLVTLS